MENIEPPQEIGDIVYSGWSKTTMVVSSAIIAATVPGGCYMSKKVLEECNLPSFFKTDTGAMAADALSLAYKLPLWGFF